MKVLINGIQFNIIESGSGSLTLVFLHYFGGSSLEWQAIMSQLSDQYHCIAIDLRGCGDSELSESGYAVNDMADDIMAVIQTRNVHDFVLVGHSMSGKAALALASRQPAGLQSLVLVSPSPPVPEPISDDDRQTMLTEYGQRFAAEQMFDKITAASVSDPIQKQIIADNLRTSKPAWDAWLLQGSKEDISARMSLVIVPASVIVGSADRAVPPDVHRHMTVPYLSNATLTIVDGPGHLLPWEIPDELAAFIAKKVAG